MKQEYMEKIYSGWLAKVIGIRLGAPIEGWTYEKIKNIYGKIKGYVTDYREFAADDDSNGPLFFLRALEHCKNMSEMEAQDVGEALLNYAPFEHGFFWWGGYGTSTEHTAYLNLRHGIKAPQSGSVAQNGAAVAEQIGGQIFIDTWGLVSPGNTDMAAKLAEAAASATHGGNGVYGGIFIAVCISHAFVENDMEKIIEKGLSYIPADCEYTRVVKAVVDFYHKNPNAWEDCYAYIHANFGYDKYPGNCHIIPNIAVMILALLYGRGDFSESILICNMCGWDTDCNVGNIATILGVIVGTEGIEYDKWRKQINDLLICSSVIGSLNIMDIPYGATYISKLAWELSGEKAPEFWQEIMDSRIDCCHFEYPGSTHVFRVRQDEKNTVNTNQKLEVSLFNTDETASTGKRSLKVIAKPVLPAENIYIYKKTYYIPEDFDDSRYDPSFSPIAYPGQTIHGSVCIPAYAEPVEVSLFAKDMRTGNIYHGEKKLLKADEWETLSFRIPALEGALIRETGYCIHPLGKQRAPREFVGFIDDFYCDGNPDYSIEMKKEEVEVWTGLHREISQFAKLKGLFYLEDGQLHLSCSDFGEAYTGAYNWKDYQAKFYLTPLTGTEHYVNFRVQGAIRSYAVGFSADKKVKLLKNVNGYQILQEISFDWIREKEYKFEVDAKGSQIKVKLDGEQIFDFTDDNNPYLEGSVGISVQNGSHCKYSKIEVRS